MMWKAVNFQLTALSTREEQSKKLSWLNLKSLNIKLKIQKL